MLQAVGPENVVVAAGVDVAPLCVLGVRWKVSEGIVGGSCFVNVDDGRRVCPLRGKAGKRSVLIATSRRWVLLAKKGGAALDGAFCTALDGRYSTRVATT